MPRKYMRRYWRSLGRSAARLKLVSSTIGLAAVLAPAFSLRRASLLSDDRNHSDMFVTAVTSKHPRYSCWR